MDDVTRRAMLAATAAGGFLTIATPAAAQTRETIPQPQRPGHGGSDPGPRNLARDRQNPDLLVPPHRSRHAAQPALLLLRLPCAAGDWRPEPSGYRAGTWGCP